MSERQMEEQRPSPANADRKLRYCLAQIGARKNYVALKALDELGWLDTFCTDLYFGSSLSKLIRLGAQLSGRSNDSKAIASRTAGELRIRSIVDFPLFAVRNRLRVKKASQRGDQYQAFMKGGKDFASRVSRCIGSEDLDGVYSFSSASLELYEGAGNLAKVLDHETPPALLEAELVHQANQRFADWSPTPVDRTTNPNLTSYQDRQVAECQLADIVVCPSTFAASLVRKAGVEASKIRVLPFAMADRFMDAGSTDPGPSVGKGLRVLFLGNDALRKGLPDLVEALELLSSKGSSAFEVRGGGAWNLTDFAMDRCSKVMRVLGGVPRSSVVEQYAWADLFVMPTTSDAMGVVILEAMAAGVPVIATTASGGPDLIRDGIDGFVVPVAAPEIIAEKLEELEQDPELRISMSTNARRRAAEIAQEYPQALGKVLKSVDRPTK